MEEQRLVEGYQVEGYFTRRNTKVDLKKKPLLKKFWRDWLMEKCFFTCSNKYIAQNTQFLMSGETKSDLGQEALEGVLLSINRFDPSKIAYKPLKKKRSVKAVYADLNDPIYHTKVFIKFTKEVLQKDASFKKLRKKYARFDLFLEGTKEWLIRQFMYSYNWHLSNCVKDNSDRLNNTRDLIHSQETNIAIGDFEKAEMPIDSDIHDERLAFVRENMSEELCEFMADKFSEKNSEEYLIIKYQTKYKYLLGQSRKYEALLKKKFTVNPEEDDDS